MGNLNPYTWVAPAATTGTMGTIFNSLTQWLLNPSFPGGINLGNAPLSATSLPAAATVYPLAMTTGTFSSAVTARQPVAHGVVMGMCYVAEAWGQGNSNEHVPLPVVAVDGVNVWMDTTSIPADRGGHYTMFFTTDGTNRGW